jgi:hypothetical protein
MFSITAPPIWSRLSISSRLGIAGGKLQTGIVKRLP